MQFVEDDNDSNVYVVRYVRVSGNVKSLLDCQARDFARALTDAADYIAEMVAGENLSDPDGTIAP